ncbi:Transketolase [gamma proteobacterium IMCC2047]|nr:Transketolase [gamma proteobacterium IMCC2047]
MVTIECSSACQQEVRYILSVIFGQTLGLEYEVIFKESENFTLLYEGKKIILPNQFFPQAENNWLDESTLPKSPIQKLVINDPYLIERLEGNDLPVIYGEAKYVFNDCEAYIGIDVFGASFFMLSLYEEAVKPHRDQLGRFPVAQSLAYQEKFLSRPIINEYIELLWFTISRVFTGFTRKDRQFRFFATQDVDNAFFSRKKIGLKAIRLLIGDITKRRSALLAVKRSLCCILPEYLAQRFDPYNTFDFFINALEAYGLKGAFFFIPGATQEAAKIHCDINESRALAVVKRIASKGHELGIHPYYGSYKDKDKLNHEKKYLIDSLSVQV